MRTEARKKKKVGAAAKPKAAQSALVPREPTAPSALRLEGQNFQVVREYSSRAARSLAQAQLHQITDEASLLAANAGLVSVKQELEKLEAARRALVQPLNIHVKNINAQFSPLTAQLVKASDLLRAKVIAFRSEAATKAEAAQAEKLEAAREAQEAGDAEEAEALATQAAEIQVIPPTLAMAEGSVSARKRWTFEVEDRSAVPDQYLLVDETAVRRAISSGIRSIAGLRIFEKDELAVSA